MIRQRVSLMIGLVVAANAAFAQSWMSAYDAGINKSRSGDWIGARDAFKQAIAYRPEDFSKPTNLPGPATERRLWRNGAPYSPNFLAAYAGLKAAEAAKVDTVRSNLLKESASELEALIAKKQLSYETFLFLNAIYTGLADNPRRMKLEEQFSQASGQLTWKVDTEVLTPEENSAIATMAGRDIDQPASGTPVVDPGVVNPPNTANPPLLSAGGTRVPVLSTKYALIIGNSETRLTSLTVPSSVDDAQYIRESLMANAGYAEQNIDLVLNATKEQMANSARAMAERIPDGATVFIFFSGVGANLDGKDFLAGVDTESVTDSSSMLSKADLYRIFQQKDARIFSFFQVNRPITNGRYFGMEVPMGGNHSQMQGTIPGDVIQSTTKGGKPRGLFADAMAATLAEFKTNKIQIQEFGWQVFYRIRKGDSGSNGGGSRQTPTLPVLTNLAFDARF